MEKIFLKLLLVFLVGGFLPVAQGALKVKIPFGTPVFGVLDERVTSGGKLHKDERRPGEPKKIAPSRVGKIVRAHVWKDVVVNGFTVNHMAFEGDRIKHMTKIWNDTISLQQLGWG